MEAYRKPMHHEKVIEGWFRKISVCISDVRHPGIDDNLIYA
jgi:hypothetical protein